MKRHIAIEAGDPVLKFFDYIILTPIPHNILFVLRKCIANIIVLISTPIARLSWRH